MSRFYLLACSGTLGDTRGAIGWACDEARAVYAARGDATFLLGEVTLGDLAMRDALRELGAAVVSYGEAVRVYRGGSLERERPRRDRNPDHEMVRDLDRAARARGGEARVVTFERQGTDPEDLELLLVAARWYTIEVVARVYDESWLLAEPGA